jgi:CBS domain-containing protein
MTRPAYEAIAQPVCEAIARRWLPTSVAAKSTPPHNGATPIWPLFVAIAIPACAGLATAWFLKERGLHSRSTTVKDVMVDDVVTAEPSMTLAEAARLMRDHNVGILPVIVNTKLAGVITDRDLVVRALADGADPTLTVVGEFVSGKPICARPDTQLEEAMEVMAECQVGRLPVVDDNNHLVGIVTLSSLVLRSREERETLHTAQEVSRRSARAA